MAEEYSKEQMWKFYEKLPKELQEVIFSEETADNIWEVCTKNGIEDERISEIARYVGRVLIGLLAPEEFEGTLEKELRLEKEVVKKIAREIDHLVFFPVKASLEMLYKTEIAPVAKPSWITPPPQEKPKAPSKEDVYRESVE